MKRWGSIFRLHQFAGFVLVQPLHSECRHPPWDGTALQRSNGSMGNEPTRVNSFRLILTYFDLIIRGLVGKSPPLPSPSAFCILNSAFQPVVPHIPTYSHVFPLIFPPTSTYLDHAGLSLLEFGRVRSG